MIIHVQNIAKPYLLTYFYNFTKCDRIPLRPISQVSAQKATNGGFWDPTAFPPNFGTNSTDLICISFVEKIRIKTPKTYRFPLMFEINLIEAVIYLRFVLFQWLNII